MKNQVQVQMAEELMIDQKYDQAMTLLIPSAEAYRKEHWLSLTTSTLLRAMKCAFLTTNVMTYVKLCLDLTNPSSECTTADKLRIEQNLWLVLDLKPPLPEPSLTGKSERASVGLAAKSWKARLENLAEMPAILLPQKSVIDFTPGSSKLSKIGEKARIMISISNSTSQEIGVKNITCEYNLPGYNGCCTDTAVISIEAGSETEVEHLITPNSKDVDKVLRLMSINFTLDNAEKFSFRKVFDSKVAAASNGLKFTPRDSSIDLKFNIALPLLIGEWLDFPIKLESRESSKASNIQVLCWLRDGGDPLISDTTCLSTFPGYPVTPTTPGGSQPLEMAKSSVVVPELDPDTNQLVRFYLRASTLGTRAIVCQLRYSVQLRGESCICSSQQVVEIPVVPPFSFTYILVNRVMEETNQVTADQHFLIVPKLTCLSPHRLMAKNSRLETRPPLQVKTEQHSSGDSNELCNGFLLEKHFPAVVPRNNLFAHYDTETVSLGKLHLSWQRTDSQIINDTIFELSSVKVSRSFMSLRCDLPPFGVLRTPAAVNFELANSTDEVQDYALTMDPSDSFMFSGPKNLRLRVFPRDTCRVRYTLYPLLAGSLALPRLKILPLTSGGVVSLDRCGAIEEIVARTLPDHMLVLPLSKCEDLQSLDLNYFELKEPTVIANLPFAKSGKHQVKS